jgi:hypothetical protein
MDPTSTTHKIKLKHFKSGTTKEWLQALNTFMIAMNGQVLDSSQQKFCFAWIGVVIKNLDVLMVWYHSPPLVSFSSIDDCSSKIGH